MAKSKRRSSLRSTSPGRARAEESCALPVPANADADAGAKSETDEGTADARGGLGGKVSLSCWQRLVATLNRSVHGASLALFRIAFGLVVLLETSDHLRPSQSSGGRPPLETYYTGNNITFNLPYEGFGWLPLLPAPWMTALVWLLCLAALTLAIGLFTRTSALSVFVLWAYLYAVESTRTYWMSYYYLVLLLSFLLVWMPSGCAYSVDALRRKRKADDDTPRVPFWTLAFLRGQLVVAYFFGGLAKVNADWLLDAMPVRYYLVKDHVIERIGRFVSDSQLVHVQAWLTGDFLPYFISYAGALFDLSIGFLLLWRRTRVFGMVLLVVFHFTNHFLLFDDIGWFPLAGLGTALIFLDPDWPEQLRAWFRRPSFPRPDWKAFWWGAVCIPGVGAALGWRGGQPSVYSVGEGNRGTASGKPVRKGVDSGAEKVPVLVPVFRPSLMPRCVAPLFLFWMTFQMLFPLRSLAIPGDARITWEGLRFSWRLKAEVYRSMPCEIRVEDPEVLEVTSDGRIHLDWDDWTGEAVLYRRVDPSDVPWRELPEIVVVRDEMVGERVLYNPLGAPHPIQTQEEAQRRVWQIWQELYGREPSEVRNLLPMNSILDGYATALHQKGMRLDAGMNLLSVLNQLHGRDGDGSMMPMLRRMNPFTLVSDRPLPGPFLLVEDTELMEAGRRRTLRLNRSRWVVGSAMIGKRDRELHHEPGPPVVIHTGEKPFELMQAIGESVWLDSVMEPDQPPYVSWNLLQDAPVSKGMHISIQPFLLRQYARRIADLWEESYGRRPRVRAITEVSLNGRPLQPVVDPDADLASVERVRFGRNDWILDLQEERIPSEALQPDGPG